MVIPLVLLKYSPSLHEYLLSGNDWIILLVLLKYSPSLPEYLHTGNDWIIQFGIAQVIGWIWEKKDKRGEEGGKEKRRERGGTLEEAVSMEW